MYCVPRIPAKNTLMRYSYAYDAAGNITVKDTEHGAYAYGYDVLDRLTSATYPTSGETFSYDKVGNRIKHNSAVWTYNANNELLTRPNVSYAYDANGSQVKATAGTTVTNYIYNGEHRLAQVKQGATTIAAYQYDPFGRRISKMVNGSTIYYFYNNEGLTAEADSTGKVLVSYGYAPNSIWGTDPMYLRVNNTYHYYLNDHLGTPQQLAMKNGARTWAAIYEAFGKATVTTSTITNNLRFPGQYADGETGLHYNLNRYFDSASNRYIKTDPIGLWGGRNNYIYANANPNYYIDPDGTFFMLPGMVIGAIAGGIGGYITSGTWEGVAAGFVVGGITGLLPGSSGIFANFIRNAITSAAGQITGNALCSEKSWSEGISFQSLIVSGVVGFVGKPFARWWNASKIKQGFLYTRSDKAVLDEAVATGFATGFGEWIGNPPDLSTYGK